MVVAYLNSLAKYIDNYRFLFKCYKTYFYEIPGVEMFVLCGRLYDAYFNRKGMVTSSVNVNIKLERRPKMFCFLENRDDNKADI
jgi:uncharacterized membrane protein